MTGNILIVDDDQSMAETLTKAMSTRGFAVTWKTSAADALRLLEAEDFDAVVTDLHMEGMDGIAFCERVVANRPDIPVIMVTAFGTMDTAVAAMRVGAYDFITKPFDVENLRLTLARAVQHRGLRDEVKRLRRQVAEVRGTDQMIGSSPPIQKVKELIDRVAEHAHFGTTVFSQQHLDPVTEQWVGSSRWLDTCRTSIACVTRRRTPVSLDCAAWRRRLLAH